MKFDRFTFENCGFQEFVEKFKRVEEKEHRVKKHHALGVLMRDNCTELMM